jgi:hypothetical protein
MRRHRILRIALLWSYIRYLLPAMQRDLWRILWQVWQNPLPFLCAPGWIRLFALPEYSVLLFVGMAGVVLGYFIWSDQCFLCNIFIDVLRHCNALIKVLLQRFAVH